MFKLIAFDIDGTLAPHHKKASEDVINRLKKLESEGYQICLISGKPIGYVVGMSRQFGLNNPIVSGENGAVIYFGTDFPIKKEIKFEYDTNSQVLLEKYKKLINKKYKEFIWVQPNEVNFSFFVENENVKKEIEMITIEFLKDSNFEYYLHPDGCFDIVYKGVNKGWAINQIKKFLGYEFHQIISVGDGSNDVPMFAESLYAIGINRKDTAVSVSNILEAFDVMDEISSITRICPYCRHEKITVWTVGETNKVLGECDKCEFTGSLDGFENKHFYRITFE